MDTGQPHQQAEDSESGRGNASDAEENAHIAEDSGLVSEKHATRQRSGRGSSREAAQTAEHRFNQLNNA